MYDNSLDSEWGTALNLNSVIDVARSKESYSESHFEKSQFFKTCVRLHIGDLM